MMEIAASDEGMVVLLILGRPRKQIYDALKSQRVRLIYDKECLFLHLFLESTTRSLATTSSYS